MKKILTSLFLGLSFSLSFAQGPVIKGVYLPVRGTKIQQVYETSYPAMGTPSAGANQVWDYSNKFINSLDTFELATFDPQDPLCNCSQYMSYFPSATHISFLRAPFPLDDSTFSFFKIDTTGVWAVGALSINSFISSVGLDTAFIAVDNELFTPAKPAYGASLTDSSRYYMYPGTSSALSRRGIKTLEGIGYGTLITPVGTFNDVLLGKETNYRWDTLGVLGNQAYSFTRYIFLRNNTFGSSVLLMQQMVDTSASAATDYAWYTLPVDFGSISGSVRDSSGTLVTACANCEAYLYRENSNFSIHDILDKSPIDASGNYFFDSIPYGIYRVAIRPDTSIYRNALTTYYGDTTNWLDADTINTLACQCNTSGRDIVLQYHPENTNSVTLSGNITLNAPYWKNGPVIVPNPLPFAQTIPGVDIIVKKTPGGKATAEVKTDNNGDFNFGKLDPGSYEMYVDIAGLFMASTYNFTITGTASNNSLDFIVGSDSIYSVTPSVGINNNESISDNKAQVFPNPTKNSSTLQLSLQEKAIVVIDVYNAIGEKCLSIEGGTRLSGIHNFQLDLTNVPSGIYFVKINEGNGKSQHATLIKE